MPEGLPCSQPSVVFVGAIATGVKIYTLDRHIFRAPPLTNRRLKNVSMAMPETLDKSVKLTAAFALCDGVGIEL